jgi:acyl-coenzyme A thioesterase PaaI-like protein
MIQDAVELQSRCHPECVACGDRHPFGLRLRFHTDAQGRVTGTFRCRPEFQGYPDRLHGGIITMVLDSAMTHCLFARKIRGVTAKLNVRFDSPTALDAEAEIVAWLDEASPPLYVLRAELRQNGVVCASAEGMFCDAESTPPSPTNASSE